MANPPDDNFIDDDFLNIMGSIDLDYVRRMAEIERLRLTDDASSHGSDSSDMFEDYFDDYPPPEVSSESVADDGFEPQNVEEDMSLKRGPDYIEARRLVREENSARLAAYEEEMALKKDPWHHYKQVLMRTVGGAHMAVGIGVTAYVGVTVLGRLARALLRDL